MLFVLHGSDTTKVADQASKLVKSILKKREGAQLFTFEGDSLSVSELDELIDARGMFVEKHVIVLKQPYVTAESKDEVSRRLERFSTTENIVVLVEGKLLAPEKKRLEKYAHKIEEHSKEEEKAEQFNVFALGDALGRKKKQDLWSGYMQALRAGLGPESIHGTLHWAVKAMAIAQRCSTAEEAGQKPYSFNKNKTYARNFTEGELLKLSRELIEMYHDARRGKHDLPVALERWILTL